ncbi:MAG: hypothetical protein ABFD89_06750 [Bryobacteraceae bacterium]
MNDLQYIFYDAKRMALDTADMTRPTELAHRKLADFIWFSDRAPRNRDETLRQLTHTPEAEWATVKGELLEKGWIVAGGFLIHRGIIASLNDAKLRHTANFNRQCAMNNKPPRVVSEPDAVTGIVNVSATAAEFRNPKPETRRQSDGSEGTNGSHAKRMEADGATRLVGDILRNSTGWSYDNSKVRPQMFVAKALVTELKPYLGRLSEKAVLGAWDTAANTTHQAVVDGLVKTNIAGYCVNSWRKLLNGLAAAGSGQPA